MFVLLILFTLHEQLIDPVPDLQMFAVLLHTHVAGRKVRAAQYRYEIL